MKGRSSAFFPTLERGRDDAASDLYGCDHLQFCTWSPEDGWLKAVSLRPLHLSMYVRMIYLYV